MRMIHKSEDLPNIVLHSRGQGVVNRSSGKKGIAPGSFYNVGLGFFIAPGPFG
jgi:hypothetical protein